jgi:hypothetical protein
MKKKLLAASFDASSGSAKDARSLSTVKPLKSFSTPLMLIGLFSMEYITIDSRFRDSSPQPVPHPSPVTPMSLFKPGWV